MRALKIAALTAAVVCPVMSAQASINLGGPVTIGLSNVDASLSDIADATTLSFETGPLGGRSATNVGDTNGLPGINAGDRTRTVGHSLLDQVTTPGGIIDIASIVPDVEITVLFRNIDGTLVDGFVPGTFFNVFDPGNAVAGTGLIEVYVDTAPVTTFDSSDPSTSTQDAPAVAVFEITSGQVIPTSPISGSTTINARLISQLGDTTATTDDDFFQVAGVTDLLDPGSNLLTFTVTTDTLSNGLTLDSISLGADTDLLDILDDAGQLGAFTPGVGGDIVAFTNATVLFDVTPEPTSLLAWCGLLGLAAAKRRTR